MPAEHIDHVSIPPATWDRWKDTASQLANVSPSLALEFNDAETELNRDSLGRILRAAHYVFDRATGEEASIARALATEIEAALAARP